jgi:hypothetical protein
VSDLASIRTAPNPKPAAAPRQWMPNQHGAWAMLAVPLLLGVIASTPDLWQLVLAVTSVVGYLASATGQAWLRARRRDPLTRPLAVYGVAFGILGLALVVAFPALLASLVVLAPTAALIVAGARPGTRRDLANSLAQAGQAVVLTPSAAWVSGTFDPSAAAIATAVGAAYLLGTVLVVRSVLRERNSTAFTALSVGFHAGLVGASVLLGPAWVVLAAALTARAAALPLAARRLARTPRPLRPVHVGAVEAVAAVAVVLVAFAALP